MSSSREHRGALFAFLIAGPAAYHTSTTTVQAKEHAPTLLTLASMIATQYVALWEILISLYV